MQDHFLETRHSAKQLSNYTDLDKFNAENFERDLKDDKYQWKIGEYKGGRQKSAKHTKS